MPRLTIVAHITVKKEKTDLVKSELIKLIATTRSEAGCVQYDLHQDNEKPAHFMFFEQCESRELWQRHMAAPHLQKMKAATEGAIEAFALHEMTRVG